MAFPSILFLSVLCFSLPKIVDSQPTDDKQALLSFFNQTRHENRLQWNSSDSPCNWFGVSCDPTQSFVYALRLPGIGLIGQIPPATLGRLSRLRVLSLRNNRLSGQLPPDFSDMKVLRNLYLQNNVFSGQLPPGLAGMTRLVRLDVSNNNFSGIIPSPLANLTHLTGLFLQNNQFAGGLPALNTTNLQQFNVSNNNLNGTIPEEFQKFNASSFAGNIDLCGAPLPPCTPSSPSPAPANAPPNPARKSSKKLSKTAIIAIAASVGGAAILILLALLLLLCLKCGRRRQHTSKPPKEVAARSAAASVPDIGTSSSKDESGISGGLPEKNKLVFFSDGVASFDLEDLLRASAEVLGKGSMGTSYKAVLEEGTVVVVKRLKEVFASNREFELQMGMVGKVEHENVARLRAFYFSKDEKLLVLDFVEGGSLSVVLHGMLEFSSLLFSSLLVFIFLAFFFPFPDALFQLSGSLFCALSIFS